MLEDSIKTQLAAYLEKLQQPIELVASPDGSDASRQMSELLADIAKLSPKVSVREDGKAERRPSISVGRPGQQRASTSPGCRWVMNSPRWFWHCCKPAAIHPRQTPR